MLVTPKTLNVRLLLMAQVAVMAAAMVEAEEEEVAVAAMVEAEEEEEVAVAAMVEAEEEEEVAVAAMVEAEEEVAAAAAMTLLRSLLQVPHSILSRHPSLLQLPLSIRSLHPSLLPLQHTTLLRSLHPSLLPLQHTTLHRLFWGTHPALIWGLFGFWGTMGGIFGTACTSAFGSNLSLHQALLNTRNDGIGSLYREGTASLLNSMATTNFPYTAQQVKEHFMAALVSDKAAAAQAQLFKKANEGHLKL
ncbi:hypothetical protein ACLOJK_008616 [Asimina triloba]